MKTNIKMRVTPEQSEAVQKICFANKIYWNKKFELIFLDSPYLFINDNRLNSTDSTRFYNGNQGEEVDADLFIRTNGTCVESTETIKVCCKEYILTNEEKEYLYNKQPYRLPKLKPYSKISQEPECQFAKYGFEKPNFECEILKYFAEDNTLVGYYTTEDGTVYAESWHSLNGRADGGVNKYNTKVHLTPIKKEWYRYRENFPCLLTNGKDFVFLTERDYEEWDGSYIDGGYRPATKEEAISLIVEVN